MISMNAFDYELPEHRIAHFPVTPRHNSKLLVYKSGNITHSNFKEITSYLPDNALLVLNETRVVPARLHFTSDTGKIIEVFILNPADPTISAPIALATTSDVAFTCLIGGRKSWKESRVLSMKLDSFTLRATWHNRDLNQVLFSWDNADLSFAEVLNEVGKIPLPPYINRDWEESDVDNYQTVYSRLKGSVAAPTAGLHFTPEVFSDLKDKGFKTLFTTLHVGAGTFLPVKTDDADEHTMHFEQMVFQYDFVENLLAHKGPIIPVGTTSCRLIESIYWLGCILEQNLDAECLIQQTDAYTQTPISKEKALENVLGAMDKRGIKEWAGLTALYIKPGYTYRVATGLITNFHQPKSTLLLLVSALIGENWTKVYADAMESDYRFLSYGDSSLLLP